MAMRLTRRRIVGALVAAASSAAIGGAVAMRVVEARRRRRAAGDAPPVDAASSRRPTWPMSSAQPLSRWLPVSGTLQPVHQATVKAKVSGEVRQITVREGETVQAGQVLARIDTADLDAKLDRAHRRARKRAARSSRSPRRRATMNVRRC